MEEHLEERIRDLSPVAKSVYASLQEKTPGVNIEQDLILAEKVCFCERLNKELLKCQPVGR
jgi:hypothetical protein